MLKEAIKQEQKKKWEKFILISTNLSRILQSENPKFLYTCKLLCFTLLFFFFLTYKWVEETISFHVRASKGIHPALYVPRKNVNVSKSEAKSSGFLWPYSSHMVLNRESVRRGAESIHLFSFCFFFQNMLPLGMGNRLREMLRRLAGF